MNATMPVWGAVALAIVVALLPQIAAFVLQRSRLSAEAALQKERMADDAEFVTDHELALIDAILLSVIGSEPLDGDDSGYAGEDPTDRERRMRGGDPQ